MNTGFARGLRIHGVRRGTRASRPRRQGWRKGESRNSSLGRRCASPPPERDRYGDADLKHQCRRDVGEEQRRAHEAIPISTSWSMAHLPGGSWSSTLSPIVMVLAFPGRRRAHRSVRSRDTIRADVSAPCPARPTPNLQQGGGAGSRRVEHLRRGAPDSVKGLCLGRSCCRSSAAADAQPCPHHLAITQALRELPLFAQAMRGLSHPRT